MFDTEIRTLIREDGTAEQKAWVTEDSMQAEAMEEAQAAFLVAEKRFRALSEHPNVATDMRLNVRWWDALEVLYECDKKLWLLFVGSDRSVRSNTKYNEYRERLINGKRLYRADA